MSKNQTKINEEDFRLLEIEVDTLAKLKYIAQVNEDTSKVTLSPILELSKLKSRHKKTKIILAPDGTIVYPQSLYLVSRLSGQGKIKDTDSIAKAMLAYSRFLESTHSETKDVNGDIM